MERLYKFFTELQVKSGADWNFSKDAQTRDPLSLSLGAKRTGYSVDIPRKAGNLLKQEVGRRTAKAICLVMSVSSKSKTTKKPYSAPAREGPGSDKAAASSLTSREMVAANRAPGTTHSETSRTNRSTQSSPGKSTSSQQVRWRYSQLCDSVAFN